MSKCGAPVAPEKLLRRVRQEQLAIPGLRSPSAPRTRAECVDGPRPCPWHDCRHHLWAIEGEERPGRRHGPTDTRPGIVRAHTTETCALDVVDRHPAGMTSQQVAELLGVTDERVRQIEQAAKATMASITHLDHHATGDCLPGCVWCALG